MGFYISLVALFFAVAAAAPKTSQRIVGGSVTTIGTYPDMVALLFSWNNVNYQQACGGVIINTRSVLTAAHCPSGDVVNRWRIRVGSTYASSGGIVHSLSNYFIHPNYNRLAALDSDIAILRSATTIVYNSNVQQARIAGANYNLQDNQVVWAAGWGTTSVNGPSSEQLRHVQIWTVDQATCTSRYASIRLIVTENMLCSGWLDVGGRDQCQGDSGGPLYHNGVVVGICSWGEQCALARFPGVNARVSRFTSWIEANA
ncbi:hypothetical protein K1T71_001706 [Dendrolimus kikuchii]|uniref:Uncharacterized protein n=1 Tax=Dendrolimus kikuchii TaxID=765133 RepID=A0ACC1DFE7_9NEOP|nr:hypothetical protein K1T71_001706 [Dendrolimus kikuchii]